MPRLRASALSALIALLIPATSAAVTISLVPDRPPTIAIGETVNVDVFIVLDASDRAVGIDSVTIHLELGAPFVNVSVFSLNEFTTVVPHEGFIVFAHAMTPVTSAMAQLGTLAITGKNAGSYDLVARRFLEFPFITAPGDATNRYDFTSDESITITIVPEPSSWLHLSLGIAGMVMIRRKLAF